MELKTITTMYFVESKIKCIYVFLLLLLLSSCGKKRDISEFVIDPPYEAKVEYMKDTIKITTRKAKSSPEKRDSLIWVKKNGKYYFRSIIIMSTEKDTSYFLPESDRIFRIKRMCVTRKMGENLYSNKIYTEIEPHHWEPQIRSESVCSNQFNCYACVRHQIEANDALVMPL